MPISVCVREREREREREEELGFGREFIGFMASCQIITSGHFLVPSKQFNCECVPASHILALFQTPWWSHARTRLSATRLMEAAPEQRWCVATEMTVMGPTGATATGITTTVAQGFWPRAPSCWSWPSCCVWPSVSSKLLLFFSSRQITSSLSVLLFFYSSIHPSILFNPSSKKKRMWAAESFVWLPLFNYVPFQVMKSI